MTTAAQVKKLVQPALERHADLALVGRWIFVNPVRHFARAVLIGRTACAEEFEPWWAIIHLFEARKTFSLNWGEFLANERSRRRGLWFMSDPDVELSLIEAIERQALPKLRSSLGSPAVSKPSAVVYTPGLVLSDANPYPIRSGARYAQALTEIVVDPSGLTGISQIDETSKSLVGTLARVLDAVEWAPRRH